MILHNNSSFFLFSYLFSNFALAFGSWGNLIRESGEAWDDGNLSDSDGCSSHCSVETGYTCYDPGDQTADICDIWGNGKRPQATGWDDGDNDSGDGWSSNWVIEHGFSCSGGSPTSPDLWSNWGNGNRLY